MVISSTQIKHPTYTQRNNASPPKSIAKLGTYPASKPQISSSPPHKVLPPNILSYNQPPKSISNQVPPQHADMFWALAWLENNANMITIPGGTLMGATGNLMSKGNIKLIENINDLYANYKNGVISKGQYDGRRKKHLDLLKKNVGPMDMEKLLFGNKTTHQSIRIARSGGLPANAHIVKQAEKLNKIAQASKVGGHVLVGVGLTASCIQIANTQDQHEKNEIFVESITSTAVGMGTSALVGLFLVSNPIGWGTAIVLAAGSTAVGYASGKVAKGFYNSSESKPNLVASTGIEAICSK
ncbi:glycine zipper family protein [Vibrio diabolicus]